MKIILSIKEAKLLKETIEKADKEIALATASEVQNQTINDMKEKIKNNVLLKVDVRGEVILTIDEKFMLMAIKKYRDVYLKMIPYMVPMARNAEIIYKMLVDYSQDMAHTTKCYINSIK